MRSGTPTSCTWPPGAWAGACLSQLCAPSPRFCSLAAPQSTHLNPSLASEGIDLNEGLQVALPLHEGMIGLANA